MYRVFILLVVGWSGLIAAILFVLSGHLPALAGAGSTVALLIALSLGSVVGGRLSVRAPSLQKLAAILMLAAWTAMPTVLVADSVVGLIATWIADARIAAFMTGLALLFVPGFLAGMLAPYAVRLLATEREDSGRQAGDVYGVAGLGVLVGAILLSAVNIDRVVWVMIASAVTLGGAALLIGRRLSRAHAT
jgi:hypothetical protein